MAQSATAIRKDIQFNWVGTDKKGNKLKGRSLAASEQALRADLRRQGVVPVKVSKQSDLFKGGGKVKPEDIAIFSRQLATMLAAGIPLGVLAGRSDRFLALIRPALDVMQVLPTIAYLAPLTLVSYDMGLSLGLRGFVAAIMGGLVSGPGAVAGALVLGLLEAFAAGLVTAAWKEAIAFLALFLILLLRPQGLFTRTLGSRAGL